MPIDDQTTQEELCRYLPIAWRSVIDQDVDGPSALPIKIDQENPALGRYSAARRVARTLFLGSAPRLGAANPGLDDKRIRLGSAQPGEAVATFGDALRRLADRANHVYQNGSRYWLALTPSVNRLADERAAQQHIDDVHVAILERLQEERKDAKRGDFAAVHVARPGATGDVPDERDVRLVILDPEQPHSRGTDSPAKQFARELLESKGTGARRYKNQVVFLAPDATRLKELEAAVRQYLAWHSICEEKDALVLDTQQVRLADTKRTQWLDTIKQRLPETYHWLLVPSLPDARASATALEWLELKLTGTDPLAVRASRKLRNDDLLLTQYAGTLLRMVMDDIPLWRGDHVTVRELADWFAQYLYLPRLRSTEVLLGAIRSGVDSLAWEQDGFAYADRHDQATGRYRGLKAGQLATVALTPESVVVRAAAARAQLDAEQAAAAGPGTDISTSGANGSSVVYPGIGSGEVRLVNGPSGGAATSPPRPAPPPPEQVLPTRFFGSVALDPRRMGRDAAMIAQELVAHLTGLPGVDAEVTLDIRVRVPAGAPEHVVRTVTENARTLKFTSAEFERE